MAWIEVHQSLFTHRKTLALADILDLPEVYVATHLIALWTWGLDNAQDGALPSSHRIIAKAAQWTDSADTFVSALVEVGYLDEMEDGEIHIHDWEEYAGRLIEKRKANAARMKAARDANKVRTNTISATHVQRTKAARAGATVPNRTVPNQLTPPTPPGGEEVDFDTWYEKEFWAVYPDRDGSKVGKAETKAFIKKYIPPDEWPLVARATRNLAKSGRKPTDPIRFFKSREYPNGFWRSCLDATALGVNGHGPDQQGTRESVTSSEPSKRWKERRGLIPDMEETTSGSKHARNQ